MPYIFEITEPTEFQSIILRGVASRHLTMSEIAEQDPAENIIMCFEVDNIKFCHLGALGHRLTEERVALIGRADILMVPWGEWIPPLIEQLNPRVVLPMHHARVDDYMRSFKGFTDLTNISGELEYTSKTLPSEIKVIMLKQSMEINMWF